MTEQENDIQKEQEPSLEELFENLEQVVSRLEGDEISLEESFQLYQKGMNLLKQCNTTIDTVEKKVQMLDENGEAHEF
ncbi:exodeoxyribonuclease VII small subunit [Muricomes intestini]|jgi:exodeoxyribonuclease VII small subunit|uniref:Exodeoxyribonuclease 7 small subunit n=1 Tax=Muricomes intestini TaxID=1796634 RepID=A0A4R3K8E3_9FIRM|nr:exodeoxyribonuclease VII small subunit [Muricomes intestini]TCS79149.1 exodeoxyribonuclease VII small subunit [Muricomes intestini]HAX51468.1 exodeoxyribonuclease VII small subunit [Lachnospiraceae bacterium]HCR84907.1 exodeoxyribonuclease VII small subunit [Lachnospiraceae bacterium]